MLTATDLKASIIITSVNTLWCFKCETLAHVFCDYHQRRRERGEGAAGASAPPTLNEEGGQCPSNLCFSFMVHRLKTVKT